MRKLAAIAALVAVALVAPAQAHKPDRLAKADGATKAAKGKARRCAGRSVGFNASGTLVSATLTVGEPGRFSGDLVVTVTRANHGAPKGEQTYTLTNARVNFRDGVDAAAPAAGSRVRISGKITKLTRKCATDGFTATVTIRKVDVKAAETAGAEEAKDADEVKKADA
jgi:hypothetical protein